MTNEQLKTTAAAMLAYADGKPIEYLTMGIWKDCTTPIWDVRTTQYRPKPEPKARPWSGPDDVPLNCWLRIKTTGQLHAFISGINARGVSAHSDALILWFQLRDYEYSTDRKNWQPCVVKEP